MPVYQVLISGQFTRTQTCIKWQPEKRSPPSELMAKVDDFWQKKADENPELFNGDLCRLSGFQVEKASLVLELGYTNYKELLYSNYCARVEANPSFLSLALGVSAVLISDDDRLILMKRSNRVGEFPGRLDVLGGHIHPRENAVDNIPDPFHAIQSEIEEELGLRVPVESFLCIGLIETLSTRKPEMIFVTRPKLDAASLLKTGVQKNSPEITEFLTVPADELASFLKSKGQAFSPSAYGALMLYLKSTIK